MNTSFTYEQAKDISEDFEDLIDTTMMMQHDPSETYEVLHVAPSPYHETDKAAFLQVYKEEKDVEKAIAFYSGSEYDVIIIAHNITDINDTTTMPIRQYIEANGIRYNFPE
jgi:hypothetical protein